MPGIAYYQEQLRSLPEWEPYLLAHSGLPGPRGNLELAHAVADLGKPEQFVRWASLPVDDAPENTPQVFLVFCGALGLGETIARREPDVSQNEGLRRLRALAGDPRWRVREAVATGLQRWGSADMAALLVEMTRWADGTRLEQRAACAALCEPRLLKRADDAASVLGLLDRVTATLVGATDRKAEDFKTLRQTLGYCWSVAVAALPEAGKPMMERWLATDDPDVKWVMRENLRKKRLAAVDPAWVADHLSLALGE